MNELTSTRRAIASRISGALSESHKAAALSERGRAYFRAYSDAGVAAESPSRLLSRAMAKRFKAAVIGGSGYGGAELIRRLLRHPDVELVARRVGRLRRRASRAPHIRASKGPTVAPFEGLTPGRSGRRDGHRPPRAAAQGERAEDARAHGDRRARRRPLGRLPPPRRGRLQALLRRRSPVPRESSTARSSTASRAQSRGDQEGEATSRRQAASRRRSSSGSSRLPSGAARGGSRDRRHHRLVRERHRPERRDAPPGPRSEPADVQAARPPAHPRDRRRRSATPARRTSPSASSP